MVKSDPCKFLAPGTRRWMVAEYDGDAEFEEEFLVATANAEEEGPGGIMKRGVRKRLKRVVES